MAQKNEQLFAARLYLLSCRGYPPQRHPDCYSYKQRSYSQSISRVRYVPNRFYAFESQGSLSYAGSGLGNYI